MSLEQVKLEVLSLIHSLIRLIIFDVVEDTHHNCFTARFRDHPGEPMPEENFWTSWCKGRLTEVATPTIRLGATPSGLTSAYLHHPPSLGNRL